MESIDSIVSEPNDCSLIVQLHVFGMNRKTEITRFCIDYYLYKRSDDTISALEYDIDGYYERAKNEYAQVIIVEFGENRIIMVPHFTLIVYVPCIRNYYKDKQKRVFVFSKEPDIRRSTLFVSEEDIKIPDKIYNSAEDLVSAMIE